MSIPRIATTIETVNGWTRMVYHNTCVAEFRDTSYLEPNHPNAGRIIRLNTGGYFTATTKKRMNQFAKMFDLPFKVVQESGVWYAYCPNARHEFEGDDVEFLLPY